MTAEFGCMCENNGYSNEKGNTNKQTNKNRQKITLGTKTKGQLGILFFVFY